jgi:hypothetical protein
MAAGPYLVIIYTQIVSALLPETGDEENIAGFVANTIQLAPFHLRMGVRVAETALLVWLAVTAKGFITGAADRMSLKASLDTFESLCGPTATLIRLYRSLSMLAYCEGRAA